MAIGAVQGSGDVSPAAGSVVTVQGVVVGDFEGASPALRGFYLQDTGDGNPATPDGIFVFNGSNDSVAVGQLLRVAGTVAEFQGQTQLSPSAVVVCGGGTVAPADMFLPFSSAKGAERYEGMLVRLPQLLSVTEHLQLGRFGQVVLSVDGCQAQPTHVVAPGAAALALNAANPLGRIILDDAVQSQNPDPILFGRGGQPLAAANNLRGSDTATGIIGVMTCTWAGNAASGKAWRVRPVGALGGIVPAFQPANARPVGTPLAKTVAALAQLDAAVVGLVEVEYDGDGASSAQQALVDAR